MNLFVVTSTEGADSHLSLGDIVYDTQPTSSCPIVIRQADQRMFCVWRYNLKPVDIIKGSITVVDPKTGLREKLKVHSY